MADTRQDSPTARSTQGLRFIPLHVSRLLLSEGFPHVIGSDKAFAAIMRLALQTWEKGAVPKKRAIGLAATDQATLDLLVSIGQLIEVDDGYVIPWLEDCRAEAYAYLSMRSEAGKKGAEGRWKKDGTAMRTHANACDSMRCDATEQDSTEQNKTGTQSFRTQDATHPSSCSAHEAPREETEAKTTKPKKNRKKGPHVALVETFQRAWAYNRCRDILDDAGFQISSATPIDTIPKAALYVPSVADYTAADRLWKAIGGDMDTARVRLKNFFASDAEWMTNAGLSTFCSKYSQLIEPIAKLSFTGGS